MKKNVKGKGEGQGSLTFSRPRSRKSGEKRSRVKEGAVKHAGKNQGERAVNTAAAGLYAWNFRMVSSVSLTAGAGRSAFATRR